jgi:hypothetical protein
VIFVLPNPDIDVPESSKRGEKQKKKKKKKTLLLSLLHKGAC